jgi:hypothetical protein
MPRGSGTQERRRAMTAEEILRTALEKEIVWWECNFDEACENLRHDLAKQAEIYFNSAGLQKKYTISEFLLDKNKEV